MKAAEKPQNKSPTLESYTEQPRRIGHLSDTLVTSNRNRPPFGDVSILTMALSASSDSSYSGSASSISCAARQAVPECLTTTEDALPPILKWAGGKRWLVQSHPHVFPIDFDRYIEPFAGSAAVFFHLKPTRAILADTNGALIECYAAIREDWSKVSRLLRLHQRQHSNEYFYSVRSSAPRQRFSRAARLIYLNRTCFNGLYRVNKKGEFNVPKGSKDAVVLATDDFQAWAEALTRADLITSDFEAIIDRAGEGDFVFVDPPYTVTHNLNGFVKYNEVLFSWDDQVRLVNSLRRALLRGASILATNADHPAIRKLYRCGFRFHSLERQSLIASSADRRGNVRELLITGVLPKRK